MNEKVPYFHLEQPITSSQIIDSLTALVENCGHIYPYYQSSLDLIEKVQKYDFIERLIRVEQQTRHRPLSHAIVTASEAALVGQQLNNLTGSVNQLNIIDTPLTATATFFHDIGNVINVRDIEDLKLDETDFFTYFINHPQVKSLSKKKQIDPHDLLHPRGIISGSHMARSISLLLHLGYPEHAAVAAHADFNLLEDSYIPIERLILMLADYAVINEHNKKEFPFVSPVKSLFDRMADAYQRHGDELEGYKRHFMILQSAKAILEESGIHFSSDQANSQGLEELNDNRYNDFDRIITFLKYFNIKFRLIQLPDEQYDL